MSPTGERVYCTYFDSRYLPRARAMIASLRSVHETGAVYALCFDDEAHETASTWRGDDVIALRLSDLEDAFPQLLTVKPTRSTAEYFFTCTPWVLSLVMRRAQDAEWVTYLDADLWFFRPVAPIYDELAGSNCGIIAHDYLPRYRRLEQYGRYNVGWVSFRRGADGEALLRWWAERCLEWCQDTPQDGRFADQGYLDDFASVAPGVVDIQNPGANLAPWNLGGRDVSTGPAGDVLVNGRPLLFFHFHGLRRRGNRYIASHLEFGARANETVRRRVYEPYVAALVAAEAELGYRPPPTARRGRGLRGWALKARRDLFDLVARARGESFPTTRESTQTTLGSR